MYKTDLFTKKNVLKLKLKYPLFLLTIAKKICMLMNENWTCKGDVWDGLLRNVYLCELNTETSHNF